MSQIFSADDYKKKVKTKIKSNKKHRGVDDYSDTLKKESVTKNPLKSFAPKPFKIFFSSQLTHEKVILLLRQHPISQLNKILIIIFAIIAPFLLMYTNFLGFLPLRFKFAFYIGWYMVTSGFILESFLIWFFHVYIITDERIIDVDFNSLIFKNISSAKIDKIEDITVSTGGVLKSLVDYGNIIIQTAGEKRELEFENVFHPSKVTKILNELILEEEREQLEGRTH